MGQGPLGPINRTQVSLKEVEARGPGPAASGPGCDMHKGEQRHASGGRIW
jgi:hypothetical protein